MKLHKIITNKNKLFAILGLTLGALILNPSPTFATSYTSTYPEHLSEVQAVIDDLQSAISTTLTSEGLSSLDNPEKGTLPNGATAVSIFNDSLDGLNTPIRLEHSLFLNYSFPASAETQNLFVDTASSALISQGFTKDQFTAPGKEYYTNQDGSITCSRDIAGASLSTFQAECAYNSWFSLTEAEVKEIKNLETAYYKAKNKYLWITTNPHEILSSIEDSSYSPYQRIDVNSIGFGANFYRKSPTSDWIFFREGQSAPSCDEYDEEAKRAFAGTTCWTSDDDKVIITPTDPASDTPTPDQKTTPADAKDASKDTKTTPKTSNAPSTPNTGVFGGTSETITVITLSLATIALLALATFSSRYALRRLRSRPSFKK